MDQRLNNVSNNDSNYMLSSFQTSASGRSTLNRNMELSDLDEMDATQNGIPRDLSITYTDNELAKLEKSKEKSNEENEMHLDTILEENSSVISLGETMSDMDNTNKTEANQMTIELEENDDEETIFHQDERSFFQYTLVELGRRLWKSSQEQQHYTKGCLWSPDGTCVLCPVHLDGMHVMELPRDLYNMEDISMEREVSQLTTAVHVKEGGTVYDYAWYPFMNSGAPESCCWLATRQHEPIHLWDAFTGELRCSYRGYDQVDEVETAISVIFSNDGEKVIGGYKKSIKVFDTNVPGRDYAAMPVKKAVSCFAFTQHSNKTVTTGSWNGYIDHYDLRTPQLGSLFTLGGHTGGVTWLKYSKKEPLMLFSGARRDNKLFQWDMRNYKEPLREFQRSVTTNQRIYFDLSPQEEWLASGDCSGLVRIWDLTKIDSKAIEVPIHTDCCNGVSFHPTLPILSTSAGQYHFVDVINEGGTEKENPPSKIVKYENSILFFWISAAEQLS